MIAIHDITGLILAGGRGSRMGGIDKGLQHYRGRPLVQHALTRLAPQVGPLMISANRNLDRYQATGVAAWPDEHPDYAGPLAGLACGLRHCKTPFLVTVPCDCPYFPLDLVPRLAAALSQEHADIAMAATQLGRTLRTQPVFCLMKSSLLPGLLAFLDSGQRKIEIWTALHHRIDVIFDDARAFTGANTLAELQQLST